MKKIILTTNLLFHIALGLNIAIFPVILKNNGVGEFFMGISGMVELSIGIFIAPYLNKLCDKIPAPKLISIFLLIYAALMLILPFYQNYILWLIFMIPMGASWFSYYALASSLYNQNLSNEKRGFMFSLFTLSIVSGLAIGTFIIKFIGSTNYLAFIICAILALSLIHI